MNRKRANTVRYSDRHKRRLVNRITEEELRSVSVPLSPVEPAAAKEIERNGEKELTPPQCSDKPESLLSVISGDKELYIPTFAQTDDNYPVLSPEPETCDKITDEHSLSLSEELRQWAFRYNIKQNAISSLLVILRNHTEFTLPKDSRTLLGTPRRTEVVCMGSGKYCHFGVERIVHNIIKERTAAQDLDLTKVDLLINIDGLPLSKSSTASLWPILASDTLSKTVYIIGAYFGKQKPEDANVYLREFVEELSSLVTRGCIINGNCVTIRLMCLICDAPAKAFVLSIKGHSGYNSCTKCFIEGVYLDNRVCFPYESRAVTERVDEGFLNNTYDDIQMKETIMVSIPFFGLVSNVPIDYMHLICLGIMKKLLTLWLSGHPLSVRLPNKDVKMVSSSLESLINTVPYEFCRKPRSLSEMLHWKATEFRTFLLYTGPLVLKPVLTADKYLNFLTLHVAIRILCCPLYVKDLQYIKYAHELLIHFVRSFEIIYGKNKMSHNVHNLLHIVKDVERFGVLDNFSAFRFENYMSVIKRTIRKSEKPLEQLFKRYTEIEKNVNINVNNSGNFSLRGQHSAGPLVNTTILCDQFEVCIYNNLLIRCNDGRNNCFMLKSGEIIVVENIVQIKKSVTLIVKYMKKLGNFYDAPCDSSDINILVVNLKDSLNSCNLSSVCCKMWRMPYKNNYIVFPLIYSDASSNNCKLLHYCT